MIFRLNLVWGLLCFFSLTTHAQQAGLVERDRIAATGEAGLSAVIDQSGPVIGCGQPVTLTATITGATEVSWKRNGEFINGATTATLIANQPGLYSVVAISLLCQIESAPVEVVLESPLNATIATPNGLATCAGGAVVLQATGGNAQWQWYRNDVALNDGTTEFYSATEPGSYVVIGNEGSVCESVSAPVDVIIHPLPVTQLVWAENPTICPGDSATILLSGAGNEEVVWYHDETILPATTNSLSATEAGEYHALFTNLITGCSAWSNSLYLEVLPQQTIEISSIGPTFFCEGESATLVTTDVIGSIIWYLGNTPLEGALDAALTVYTGGVYTTHVTDANGCTFVSNPLSIETLSLPDASLTYNALFPVVCGEEDTLVVSTSPGNTYTWYSQDELLVSEVYHTLAITTPGIYSVDVMSSNGCHATSQTLEVLAFDAPELLLEPAGLVNVCEGQIQLFEAFITAPAQLQWYADGVLLEGETNSFLETTEAGNYQVSIIDDNGCEAISETAILEVIVVNTPIITDGGITAQGQLLLTDAASGHQWYWNGEMIPGATGSDFLATEDGIYSVISIEDVCESELSAGFEVILGGVSTRDVSRISVYPNPCSDFIRLEMSPSDGTTFSVFDSSGTAVYSEVVARVNTILDVQSWAAGLYHVVTNAGMRVSFQLVR